MGSLIRVQGPQVAVAEVDWVKQFIKVDTAADDERIQGLIDAATSYLDGADGILGRALQQQTWQLNIPGWPTGQLICLPLPPLIAVSSITYLDGDGAEQTLAADQYRVVNLGARRSYIEAADGVTWPNTYEARDAVRVTFDAGYQDEQSPANNPVPMAIRQALVMMVQSWYDRPALEDIPPPVASLVASFKVNRLGA